MESDLSLVGVVGFEPTEWRSQSPLPYHLATPQNLIFSVRFLTLSLTALILYHKKKSLSTLFLNFFYFFLNFLL